MSGSRKQMPVAVAVNGIMAKVGSSESLKARHSADVDWNSSACVGEQKLCGVSGGATGGGGAGGGDGGDGGESGKIQPVSCIVAQTTPEVVMCPAQQDCVCVAPEASRVLHPMPPHVPHVAGQQMWCEP